MGEQVLGEASFRETVDQVSDLLADIANYPSWNSSILEATVLDRDSTGRVTEAAFVIDIKLTRLQYTLGYAYTGNTVSWQLLNGDLLNQFDGSYAVTHADGSTRVNYSIDVDVAVALPKVMKRRAAEMMLQQTLNGLHTQLTAA
jgi:ribosome-associated toxin RatA of RatAB toxin-antitoxin module